MAPQLRDLRLQALGLSILSLLTLTGCRRLPEEANVVLVTVDTLRADHLGIYGNRAIRTPNIDELGRSGVVFRNAYAPTHLTIPSHLSLLTSLYLKEHGSYSNRKQHVEPSLTTLQRVLRQHGYQTAAVTSLGIMKPDWATGLESDFDLFSHPAGFERTAAEATAVVEAWLDENRHENFFLWLHLFDPHMPYKPPAPYNSYYYQGDPRQGPNTLSQATLARAWAENKIYRSRFLDWLEPIHDIQFPGSQYKGEISYVDEQIGRLRQLLDRHRLDNTWVILTADHGENLGEHRIWFDHQGLFRTTLAVPLLIWHSTFVRPRLLDELVMTIDIMPTVLDLLEISSPSHRSGRSLAPLIRGNDQPIRRYAFAEATDQTAISVFDGEWRFTKVLKRFAYSDAFSLLPGDRFLFRMPEERENLILEYPEVTARLEQVLDLWAEGSLPAIENRELSEEEQRVLEALGYL